MGGLYEQTDQGTSNEMDVMCANADRVTASATGFTSTAGNARVAGLMRSVIIPGASVSSLMR